MRQTEIGVASEEALDGVVEESDEGKFIQGHTCGEWDIPCSLMRPPLLSRIFLGVSSLTFPFFTNADVVTIKDETSKENL